MAYPAELLPITLGLFVFGSAVVAFAARHVDIGAPVNVDFDLGIEVDPRNQTILFVDDLDCDCE